MKPLKCFKSLPFLARCIIVVIAAAGFMLVAFAIHSQALTNPDRFIFLLILAAVTAQAKTKFYQQATISFLTAIVMIAVPVWAPAVSWT